MVDLLERSRWLLLCWQGEMTTSTETSRTTVLVRFVLFNLGNCIGVEASGLAVKAVGVEPPEEASVLPADLSEFKDESWRTDSRNSYISVSKDHTDHEHARTNLPWHHQRRAVLQDINAQFGNALATQGIRDR